MGNKKTLIIGILCALVVIMAVGYAVLATQLNITGIASIDSTWRVEITNITEKDIVGDATSKVAPSYSATTANFSVGLTQPGDSITYDIEVSNLGTLKAKVDSINVTMNNNDAIVYKTEGLVKGDTLGVNEKDTLSITVSYNPEVTSQPSVTLKEITVTINYVQDLGISSEPSTTYDYVIGDTVTFAGSNWYVIKNSTSEEDYVTLLKEKILTSSELGDYAYSYTYTCDSYDVQHGIYGCTTIGEKITNLLDTMEYYWSDTCHYSGVYGYTDYDSTGCEGHNDYEESKVKEFLEGTYINTLGVNNLKEVDGYKVRLITRNELNANLGWTALDKYATESDNSDVPSWAYQGFAEEDSSVSRYWTMTADLDYPSNVWNVTIEGLVGSDTTNCNRGVRPVINLLKSSI